MRKQKKFWKKFIHFLTLSIAEERLNILEYTNIDTYPVNIEFFEAGGPVASNYKYITHIRVFSKSGKIFLNYREVREFLSGKPRLVVSNEKELSQEVYKEFLVDLLHHRILELNRNFIPKESRHF